MAERETLRQEVEAIEKLTSICIRADSYLSLLWSRFVPESQKDTDLRLNVDGLLGELRSTYEGRNKPSLFDVLTAALPQPDAGEGTAEVIDNLEILYNTIGDLRGGFSRAVSPERWVRDTQTYLRQQINRLSKATPADAPPALTREESQLVMGLCNGVVGRNQHDPVCRAYVKACQSIAAKCRAHAERSTR